MQNGEMENNREMVSQWGNWISAQLSSVDRSSNTMAEVAVVVVGGVEEKLILFGKAMHRSDKR